MLASLSAGPFETKSMTPPSPKRCMRCGACCGVPTRTLGVWWRCWAWGGWSDGERRETIRERSPAHPGIQVANTPNTPNTPPIHPIHPNTSAPHSPTHPQHAAHTHPHPLPYVLSANCCLPLAPPAVRSTATIDPAEPPSPLPALWRRCASARRFPVERSPGRTPSTCPPPGCPTGTPHGVAHVLGCDGTLHRPVSGR